MEKVCVQCKATKSCRWYGGPICNRCHGLNFRIQNPGYHRQYQKEKYQTDLSFREKDASRKKLVYLKFKDKIIENKRKYNFNKSKTDVLFRLCRSLRSRLNKAIKGNYKAGSAVHDLGCSIAELKLHLESKFQPGMTWENYGEWHIDHIKPLAAFDLTKEDQVQSVCNHMNLQPLWAKDNIMKGRL